MKDRNGKDLKIGDIVIIFATVTNLVPGANVKGVTVRPNGRGDHQREVFSLFEQECELVPVPTAVAPDPVALDERNQSPETRAANAALPPGAVVTAPGNKEVPPPDFVNAGIAAGSPAPGLPAPTTARERASDKQAFDAGHKAGLEGRDEEEALGPNPLTDAVEGFHVGCEERAGLAQKQIEAEQKHPPAAE